MTKHRDYDALRAAALRLLAENELSRSEIAARLGVTKNVICGIAHRARVRTGPRLHSRGGRHAAKPASGTSSSDRAGWKAVRDRACKIAAAARALSALPPLTEAESARLVADHIARRGVTSCPPAYAAPVLGAAPLAIPHHPEEPPPCP